MNKFDVFASKEGVGICYPSFQIHRNRTARAEVGSAVILNPALPVQSFLLCGGCALLDWTDGIFFVTMK